MATDRAPRLSDYQREDYVTRRVAAAMLGCSPRTMEGWASKGTGPLFVRGGRALYMIGDMLDWLDENKVKVA